MRKLTRKRAVKKSTKKSKSVKRGVTRPARKPSVKKKPVAKKRSAKRLRKARPAVKAPAKATQSEKKHAWQTNHGGTTIPGYWNENVFGPGPEPAKPKTRLPTSAEVKPAVLPAKGPHRGSRSQKKRDPDAATVPIPDYKSVLRVNLTEKERQVSEKWRTAHDGTCKEKLRSSVEMTSYAYIFSGQVGYGTSIAIQCPLCRDTQVIGRDSARKGVYDSI